jgi:hypothetical protein
MKERNVASDEGVAVRYRFKKVSPTFFKFHVLMFF